MTGERYLAIVGLPEGCSQSAAIDTHMSNLGLRRHGIVSEFIIYASPLLPVMRATGCAIIGEIFGETAALHADCVAPANIIDICWGNYLGFGLSRSQGPSWILRAPIGHLPAFRRIVDGAMLISSHAELLFVPDEPTPQIDWSFVSAHLACQHLQTRATGIVEVDELLGGESLVRNSTGLWQRRLEWSPWHFTTPEREIDDPIAAKLALRAGVEHAVASLSASGATSLLELSGGLDSSILAASLASVGARASGVTLVTQGAEGDERVYARATAAATGLALEEIMVSQPGNLAKCASTRLARPGLPAILAGADQILTAMAREYPIGIFMSGAGGDCVFCSPASAAPAADVIRRFGCSTMAWRAIDALARIHHASVWAVARMARRQSRSGPDHVRWPITPGLLAPDRVPAVPPEHPWQSEPASVLPGKRSHVRSIMAALAHVDGFGRSEVAPVRFPLLSQPVIESVLRIPSWLWIADGRDRSLARDAWHGLLPAIVLDRRTKGGLDSYAIEALEKSRAMLLPFLLDGHLAHNGVIDRQRVEHALRATPSRTDPSPYLLLPIIDAEAWARAWLGAP